MIGRLPAFLIVGCVVFAGLILMEVDSHGSDVPAVEPRLSEAEGVPVPPRTEKPRLDDLIATALASPLFSPTRHPPEVSGASDAADPGLTNVRLTGIVIEPDRRIAIFAVTGGKPLVLTEGEAVQNWRLDSITPEQVSVIGPSGTRILEPKPDVNAVRPPPPAPTPAQPPPGAPPVSATGAVPGQPNVATPKGRAAQPVSAPPRSQFPANAPAGAANPARAR
jgi:hypothetical protein